MHNQIRGWKASSPFPAPHNGPKRVSGRALSEATLWYPLKQQRSKYIGPRNKGQPAWKILWPTPGCHC